MKENGAFKDAKEVKIIIWNFLLEELKQFKEN
jgi:hypothetical protein